MHLMAAWQQSQFCTHKGGGFTQRTRRVKASTRESRATLTRESPSTHPARAVVV